MQKLYAVVLFILVSGYLCAQQQQPKKFALIIGNGNYSNMSRLTNPVNDANDMADALKGLGFTVDKIVDGSLAQMEGAVIRLKNQLSVSKDSYGFFFYAGHGVQSGGLNYLIPVGVNIPDENFLRERAVSVQTMLGMLNDAGNELNIVVLDACRDNPFGWARSGSRGLTVVTNQPADSIIVYATSAGSTAADGTGRNGLFTSQLLKNIKSPGLEVKEVFNRTGADVQEASGRRQVPAIYNQFFKAAYLGSAPQLAVPVFEAGAVGTAIGKLEISTVTAGTIRVSGGVVNQSIELPEWGNLPIEKINAGSYKVTIHYEDGKVEEKTVVVGRSEAAKLEFTYRPVQPKPLPLPKEPKTPKEPKMPKGEKAIAPADTKLWTIGVSTGTSFSAPLVFGTVRGTLAPFKYSFFEIGMDMGGVSNLSNTAYFSLYPYANYALFVPFAPSARAGKRSGWYAGAGFGAMCANYTFGEVGPISVWDNTFTMNIVSGFSVLEILDISYTALTDFKSITSKLSVGYSYRFRQPAGRI